MLRQMLDDPWYELCCYPGCEQQAELEHAWTYSGRQINEVWAIIPCCPYHNRGKGLNKTYNQWVALRRATAEDLAKYPRIDWATKLAHLNAKYAKY